MKNIIFTLLLVSCANILYSQDYIVTLQYDTLYGEVELLLPSDTYEELSFSNDDGKRRLKAYQILAASEDSVIYKPVKHAGKYRFMEEVIEGYLGLYMFRLDGSFDFGAQYLLKKTRDGLEVPNFSFRKLVTDFLSDCESVMKKIEDRTYRKADLNQIVNEYNACINAVETPADKETIMAEGDASKVELIQAIRTKLGSEINGELKILLNDIESKIKKNQKVPGYLIGALKDQTEALDKVNEEVTQLVEKLN